MKTKSYLLIAALLLALAHGAQAGCVTDDTDEKVCMDGKPVRVVSLYGAFSELLLEVGGGESIIGRTKADTTIPAMEKLPVVGTGLKPNTEYIMALNPDLVVARGGKAGAEALTMLRQRGVKVAAFDPQSIEELYSVIARLGTLWGREGEARNLNSKISSDLKKIADNSSRLPSRPTVVFEISAEPLMVAGSEGLLNELITIAGGENAITVKKRLVRLDAEALLAANPDYYIIQTGPMNANPPPPSERAHHSKLDAVKFGRVTTVEEKLFSRPGPRVAEAARELFKILHK